MGSRGRAVPEGLVLGGDCPKVGADADDEIHTLATSRIPLKVGLTLTTLWLPNPGEEYECLHQVTTVDRDGFVFTIGCTDPRRPEVVTRRVCRSDLRGARMLHAASGMIEVIDASGEPAPETVVGATEFSLSAAQLAELRSTGTTRHHYVQFGFMDGLTAEATAVLRHEGTETAVVMANDRPIDVPVIRVSGDATLWTNGRETKGRVTALVLDDDLFPLLIDYRHTAADRHEPAYRLYFAKLSFPASVRWGTDPMERELVERKRVDVHGIYFDFNSDGLRKESEPILAEIAGMLARNPQWTLSIGGHTDNVGGQAFNQELSSRRAAAVKRALVSRFKVSAERLQTTGYGLSAPTDTNDTPEGRARNRRVALVRH
jgi:outer membrane protein OmpA-like peptidoglycan-associated protein